MPNCYVQLVNRVKEIFGYLFGVGALTFYILVIISIFIPVTLPVVGFVLAYLCWNRLQRWIEDNQ